MGGVIYGSAGHQVLFGIGAGFAVGGAVLGWRWLPRRGAKRYAEPVASPDVPLPAVVALAPDAANA
jgi:hypothetical protein